MNMNNTSDSKLMMCMLYIGESRLFIYSHRCYHKVILEV